MDLIKLLGDTFYIILILSAAPLLSSLATGLIISIFQASTQIQDASLAFIPKVLIVFGTILLMSSWGADTMSTFTIDLFSKISEYGR